MAKFSIPMYTDESVLPIFGIQKLISEEKRPLVQALEMVWTHVEKKLDPCFLREVHKSLCEICLRLKKMLSGVPRVSLITTGYHRIP